MQKKGIDLQEPDSKRADRYLSDGYCRCVKGIAALGVLIHHIYQYSGLFQGTIFGTLLQSIGCLCVGLFFFYSGYGLMISSKKTGYIDHFIVRRFVPLYGFYSCLVLLYSCITLLLRNQLSAESVAKSFLFRETVVPLGWYFQITFFLYLLYYIVFASMKTETVRIVVMSVMIFLLCFFCHRFEILSSYKYEGLLCVIGGMIWCQKKEKIDCLLEGKAVALSGGCFVLFSALFIASLLTNRLILKMAAIISFTSFAVSVSYCLSDTKLIDNPITQWLGRYSLYIYASQGVFLLLRKSNVSSLQNPLVFAAVTFLGTGIAAVSLHCARQAVSHTMRKMGIMGAKK